MGIIFPHIHDKGNIFKLVIYWRTQGSDVPHRKNTVKISLHHQLTFPIGDAQAAVSITKYPPQGKRSMTGQLPLFSLKQTPIPVVVEKTNLEGSTVILMIETLESIKNIDEIARTEGVDLLLIGANDLSIELGVPSQFDSQVFRGALETVSGACKRHGKVMGLAGIYDNSAFQQWAVDVLGVRFILGQQDSGILARHAKECLETLQALDPK